MESRSRRIIHTEGAPQAVGPYSQAVIAGGFLFSAGQIGLEPGSGRLVGEGIEEQTRQVLSNLQAVLQAAGLSFRNVVRTTIFLTDMEDFATVNRIYAEFFDQEPPARSTVQVAALPLQARVEMDVIASLG